MDQMAAEAAGGQRVGPFAPLGIRTYRNFWLASIFSNIGTLVFGVGAAWEMTRLTDAPAMVALVQTSLMLPMFLVTLPAGAIADMFDRRKVVLTGLAFSTVSATALTVVALLGLLTPWLLLGACAVIGAGAALFGPAWQASIRELVDRRRLPAAIALGSVSYNLGRSAGPAVGGLIVLAFGAIASFGFNAISYMPLMVMFFLWQRVQLPSRLPPERLERAIVSGARYSFHSTTIRTSLIRIFLLGVIGSATSALAPLIARDVLDGNAGTFGILLCSIGAGAVCSALLMGVANERFGVDKATQLLVILAGLGTALAGLSRSLPLTCFALFLAGGAYTLIISMTNVTVQMSAPRWVVARALSLYTSGVTGGVALGAWIWGTVAGATSISAAMSIAGVSFGLLHFVFRLLPIGDFSDESNEPVILENQPKVALGVTMRSGPIVIVIEYEVDPADARSFYDAMQELQTTRLRNGGFAWSLSRDIARPAHWAERFQFPTWGDYLRMRDRMTAADMETSRAASSFIVDAKDPIITRRLERPFGSVRWKADSPDPQEDSIDYYPH